MNGFSPGPGMLLKAGVPLFTRVEVLASASARGRGLLGRRSLPEGHAVLLAPCSAIHTWFMRFSLDVVFLGANLAVTRICRDVRPFRMAWGARGTRLTLECQAGWLPAGSLRAGDCLEWRRREEGGEA